MKQTITAIVESALKKLGPSWGLDHIPEIGIEIPRNESHGDVAVTVAMGLTKVLKKPPREIAEELLNEINALPGPFEKIEIAGPGFINFTFNRDFFLEQLEMLLVENHSSIGTNIGSGRKVQIEFVSA
ncbi:MAG TPA: arginine--tRNA ligase, partial [Nitrospirae bacterium]|nr:arginine--tRNA ligase [Nitrospirota bacterium]